jgi:hypothetical protein
MRKFLEALALLVSVLFLTLTDETPWLIQLAFGLAAILAAAIVAMCRTND